MANYSLTYSCGHQGTAQLVGKETERERRIAWLEREGLCPDCYKAKKEADRAAENASSAEANKALPALDGTERQVAWAETIRAKALASKGNKVPAFTVADGFEERIKPLALAPEDAVARLETLRTELAKARSRLETETSAKWWIDNRHKVDSMVIDAYTDGERRVFADVYERREREKRKADERVARESREQEAARAAEAKARQEAVLADMVPKARSFTVSDQPGAVTVKRDDVMIRSTDGRTARGAIDEGEWMVFEIVGEGSLGSMHPEMERIAREAKAVWERSRN